MTNWTNSPGRWAWTCRRAIQQAWLKRQVPRHPAVFRQVLKLNDGADVSLGQLLQTWQQQDFAALDRAWQHLAGTVGHSHDQRRPGIQRAWIERPRGHAKTSDMAVQLAWVLAFARRSVTGLAAAADLDQAGLIRDAVVRLINANSEWLSVLTATRHEIRNRRTGSVLKVISSDAGSSYGALPDFVICDELCHWEQPDLWHSLLSAAAKQTHCVLAVLTNAGVGRGWQWDAREAIRRAAECPDPVWHFSTLAGVQAPWIDRRLLDEQRQLLPDAVYRRLWENIWQDSEGEFVTLAEADACCDPRQILQTVGHPGRHYLAAVDYAEKHDRTVGVVLHCETTGDGELLYVVDRMDVVAPQPDRPVPVAWVSDWIREMARTFGSISFVLDEWQLLGVIQQLAGEVDIRRFPFAGGEGNHRLAVALRRLVLSRQLRWYSGCGQIPDVEERDDLATELASLRLKQSAGGRCRIDHRREHRFHDDRAFALGAACLLALSGESTPARLEILPPTDQGHFAW